MVTVAEMTQFMRDLKPLADEGFSFDKKSEHIVLVTAPWGTKRYITFKGVLEASDPVRYVIDHTAREW